MNIKELGNSILIGEEYGFFNIIENPNKRYKNEPILLQNSIDTAKLNIANSSMSIKFKNGFEAEMKLTKNTLAAIIENNVLDKTYIVGEDLCFKKIGSTHFICPRKANVVPHKDDISIFEVGTLYLTTTKFGYVYLGKINNKHSFVSVGKTDYPPVIELTFNPMYISNVFIGSFGSFGDYSYTKFTSNRVHIIPKIFRLNGTFNVIANYNTQPLVYTDVLKNVISTKKQYLSQEHIDKIIKFLTVPVLVDNAFNISEYPEFDGIEFVSGKSFIA